MLYLHFVTNVTPKQYKIIKFACNDIKESDSIFFNGHIFG